jgi:cytochrome P450
MSTLHLLPQAGRIVEEFNEFAKNLAMQRTKKGAVATMDLSYHLASLSLSSATCILTLRGNIQTDEAGLEKEQPTLETAAGDGVTAIIAASDTTASTMSSLVWLLLSNPKCYERVQQELDNVFVNGDDFFDVGKHQELHFLSACM